ncbi:hypothetical protein BDF14DRAFT_1780986 [Spinellus fusiger]|nr:hypothetical protein BDF14DRAFT_1780986 [Spinellus fusiger]
MMILILIMALGAIASVSSQVHCRDPSNCPYYPVHSCFATELGLVCGSRSDVGYEMSNNIVETFSYTQPTTINDTGLPCTTIPLSDELYSYVDYRGPTVIEEDDLHLIGNCSRMSYCDKKKKTCQPKRPVGSRCHHNMQCYFGTEGFPGYCKNHSVCSIREGLPAYYYRSSHQWTLGKQWQSATVAVLATGTLAFCLLYGRQQATHVATRLRWFYEKVYTGTTAGEQARDSGSIPVFQEESGWQRYHGRWWKQVPGLKWVYQRFKRESLNEEVYVPLTHQERVEEPPPYRG